MIQDNVPGKMKTCFFREFFKELFAMKNNYKIYLIALLALGFALLFEACNGDNQVEKNAELLFMWRKKKDSLPKKELTRN